MAVTMTVTPEPNHAPPRVKIELDTNDTARLFSAIEIRRDGQVIRAKAPIGSSTSVTFDYDCDYGQSVTYSATGESGATSALLDEDWSDLTGWTTVSGTPAVAGGKLTSGVVQRAFPGGNRLIIHDAAEMASGSSLSTLSGGFPGVSINGDGTSIAIFDAASLWGQSTLPGTGDWQFAAGGGDGQVTSTDGSWTTPNWLYGDTLRVSAPMPGFVFYDGTSPESFSVTADTELDGVEAWLIHPTTPDLSVQLTTTVNGHVRKNRIWVDSDSAKSVSYPAQREVFAPLGRSRQVPVTYGKRRPGEWSLVVRTPRPEDRAAMLSLLDDQSPLLLRTPPGFEWDLADDWYSVDTVDDTRVADLSGGRNPRIMTLPLIPVDEPVLIQGAQWTYADDLIRNPTYADSLAEFPTYFDRLVGPS